MKHSISLYCIAVFLRDYIHISKTFIFVNILLKEGCVLKKGTTRNRNHKKLQFCFRHLEMRNGPILDIVDVDSRSMLYESEAKFRVRS